MSKIVRSVRAPLILAIVLLGATPVLAADATPARVDSSQPTAIVYPPTAQVAGEQGTVIVDVFVGTNGKVSRYAIAKSSGFDDLDNAALESVMNWHYVPASRDGDTVGDWAQVNVVYKLPN